MLLLLLTVLCFQQTVTLSEFRSIRTFRCDLAEATGRTYHENGEPAVPGGR
jgi:hypothetical protein